nr:alginate lyase family protein [Planctomycetota bacterium]
MKRLQHASSVVYLVVLASGAAAAEVRHPNLLFNRQELADLKAKIEKYPWARQTFERIRADAEADSSNPHHNVPTKVATALMYALTGEEPYAKRARHHVTSNLKNYQEAKNYHWNRGVLEAIMYDLVYDTFSENERREIEDAFRRAGRLQIELAESGYQTWNMKWVEHWNVAMMGYVTGDRQLIDYGLNDPGGGLTSGKIYCGYDPEKYGGFYQVIERHLKEGTWHEPPEYLFNAICYPFMTLALAAKHYDGTDLYRWRAPNGNSLSDVLPRYIDLTFPAEESGVPGGTFRIANYGDGGTTAWRDWFLINSPWQLPAAEPPAPPRLADEIYTTQGMLEVAHHLDPRPVYAWLLTQPTSRDRMFCNSGAGFLGLSRPALGYGRPLDDAPSAPPPA